jgi:hypothetical protein
MTEFGAAELRLGARSRIDPKSLICSINSKWHYFHGVSHGENHELEIRLCDSVLFRLANAGFRFFRSDVT